jgi:hypothetical protein
MFQILIYETNPNLTSTLKTNFFILKLSRSSDGNLIAPDCLYELSNATTFASFDCCKGPIEAFYCLDLDDTLIRSCLYLKRLVLRYL